MTNSNSYVAGLLMLDIAILNTLDKLKRKRIKQLKLKRNIRIIINYIIILISVITSIITIIT